MREGLNDRLRRYRTRAAIRSWGYRQRRHAHGAWYRLRRVLADAETACTVPEEVVQALLAEGYRPEPVGAEFHPPRTIIFVPAERLAAIASARPLRLRLDAGLLAADCLVLTPFRTVAR